MPGERTPGPSEDTGYYTRCALKLGLRAALDMRELLGLVEKLRRGKHDLHDRYHE